MALETLHEETRKLGFQISLAKTKVQVSGAITEWNGTVCSCVWRGRRDVWLKVATKNVFVGAVLKYTFAHCIFLTLVHMTEDTNIMLLCEITPKFLQSFAISGVHFGKPEVNIFMRIRLVIFQNINEVTKLILLCENSWATIESAFSDAHSGETAATSTLWFIIPKCTELLTLQNTNRDRNHASSSYNARVTIKTVVCGCKFAQWPALTYMKIYSSISIIIRIDLFNTSKFDCY